MATVHNTAKVGVYRITNTVSGCVYIGSAIDMKTRMAFHAARLRCGKHDNQHLQRSWDKYGESVFIFEPLIECSIEARKEREQRFIDAYILHELPLYNTQPSAASNEGFQRRLSEETKDKIRRGNIGKVLSQETKDRIRTAATGRKLSDETRKKISLAGIGRPISARVAEILKQGREGRGKSI